MALSRSLTPGAAKVSTVSPDFDSEGFENASRILHSVAPHLLAYEEAAETVINELREKFKGRGRADSDYIRQEAAVAKDKLAKQVAGLPVVGTVITSPVASHRSSIDKDLFKKAGALLKERFDFDNAHYDSLIAERIKNGSLTSENMDEAIREMAISLQAHFLLEQKNPHNRYSVDAQFIIMDQLIKEMKENDLLPYADKSAEATVAQLEKAAAAASRPAEKPDEKIEAKENLSASFMSDMQILVKKLLVRKAIELKQALKYKAPEKYPKEFNRLKSHINKPSGLLLKLLGKDSNGEFRALQIESFIENVLQLEQYKFRQSYMLNCARAELRIELYRLTHDLDAKLLELCDALLTVYFDGKKEGSCMRDSRAIYIKEILNSTGIEVPEAKSLPSSIRLSYR